MTHHFDQKEDKEKTKSREYFKIEKHPKQDKIFKPVPILPSASNFVQFKQLLDEQIRLNSNNVLVIRPKFSKNKFESDIVAYSGSGDLTEFIRSNFHFCVFLFVYYIFLFYCLHIYSHFIFMYILMYLVIVVYIFNI